MDLMGSNHHLFQLDTGCVKTAYFAGQHQSD